MWKVVIAILLAGCATRPLDDASSDGGTPVTGAYQLTISPLHDDCFPQAEWPQPKTVFVAAEAPVLELLIPLTHFAGESPSFHAVTLIGDAVGDLSLGCGGLGHEGLVLTQQSRQSITVEEDETWTGVAGKGVTCETPQKDCSLAVSLRYHLLLACEKPCVTELIIGLNGEDLPPACHCPAS
jgi:hypothetical protein